MTFTEHSIRPEYTAQEQQRLVARDLERLMRMHTQFVDVPCPACDGQERQVAFEKQGQVFQRCAACATVYVSPRPPPAVLHDYYAQSEAYTYWAEVIFPASEAVRRERIFKPRVQKVLSLTQARGTLVEVGAGFGTFLTEARAHFDNAIAIEPTPALARACRARGLSVIECTAEDAPAQSADVVVSFEVIEHAFHAGHFVQACTRHLRPGGLLLLTCPNLKGFDIEVLGPASPAVDFEHLNYFHPASLRLLLERHGLQVLHTETPGQLDADIVRNRVLAGHPLTDPFLRRVLIDEWDRLGAPFQRFLQEQGLSSNMWVVARLV